MDNIQSNYPRKASHGLHLADLVPIRRASTIGQISLIVLALVLIASYVFPSSPESGNDATPFVLDLPTLVTIASLFAIIGAIWGAMFWVTRTHRAVCALRGIKSRMPSRLLGFLSGIPLITFFLPICYALDFLVVRSQSDDMPTLRWYSLLSKSKIVNFFAFAIIANCTVGTYDLIKEYVWNRPSTGRFGVSDFLQMITLFSAIASGIIIAKIVNRNIESILKLE